jgi:hypothetical protein
MIDRTKILDVMEQASEEIFIASDIYKEIGRQGGLCVQIQNEENPNQWEDSFRFFGRHFRTPRVSNGRNFDTGGSFDAMVHAKMAYTKRTGKPSGCDVTDTCGNETFIMGALMSADGKCICGYSGYPDETDDVRIAQKGLDEYERQKNA